MELRGLRKAGAAPVVQLPQGEPRAPIIGDRRPSSKLGDIQPDHWLAEYTTELINLLNVLGQLVNLEQSQAELLERVCAGHTITFEELRDAGALRTAAATTPKTGTSSSPNQLDLLD
jgi:hypothetical protein